MQPGGPPLWAAALGPRSRRRAAAWADGVTGFSVGGLAAEMAAANRGAEEAWAEAGRQPPYKVNGCFYVVGVADPLATLRAFARRYLAIFGAELADALTDTTWVASPDDLHRLLDEAEGAGCDELILVPGTVDERCLELTAEVVARR